MLVDAQFMHAIKTDCLGVIFYLHIFEIYYSGR